MTRTPQISLAARARSWRVAFGVAAVAAASIGLSVVPGDAEAARRTSSAAIAEEAGRALEALDRWEQNQNPADYVRFVQGRAAAATVTAAELDVDDGLLRAAWASVPSEKQRAVLAAMSQLGVPYRSLESEPGVGFDCSGLTNWAFAEAGVEIPRVSRDQIHDAEIIERDAAVPGDLVYYPGHVGIYLGVETYVHSPNPGNDVEAVHLPSKSLRFGDAVIDRGDDDSLVDGSRPVAE